MDKEAEWMKIDNAERKLKYEAYLKKRNKPEKCVVCNGDVERIEHKHYTQIQCLSCGFSGFVRKGVI